MTAKAVVEVDNRVVHVNELVQRMLQVPKRDTEDGTEGDNCKSCFVLKRVLSLLTRYVLCSHSTCLRNF